MLGTFKGTEEEGIFEGLLDKLGAKRDKLKTDTETELSSGDPETRSFFRSLFSKKGEQAVLKTLVDQANTNQFIANRLSIMMNDMGLSQDYTKRVREVSEYDKTEAKRILIELATKIEDKVK